MFKRYGEVVLRLEKLGSQVGKLNNNERQELQSLLEEQVWLGSTVVKKARSVLEEIDQSFEKLFDWMISISDLIERASGQNGTPEDIVHLERVMAEAVSLREQLRRLNIENKVPAHVLTDVKDTVIESRAEAAPAAARVTVELPKLDSPINIPVKKKVRKKKVKAGATNLSKQYSPPQELLNAIADRVTPLNHRKVVEVLGTGLAPSINLASHWPHKTEAKVKKKK